MAREPQVAEIVHIRAEVRQVDLSRRLVSLNPICGATSPPTGPYFFVSLDAIVHVEPPPIKVGDTVRHRSMDWTVIGIYGELLWIKRTATYGVDHASLHRDEVQRYS